MPASVHLTSANANGSARSDVSEETLIRSASPSVDLSDEDTITSESPVQFGLGNDNAASTESKQTPKSTQMKGKKKGVDMTPPEDLLRKTSKKARRLQQEEKFQSAVKEYLRCTALARIAYGDNHWKYSAAYVDLADAFVNQQGYFQQAEYYANTAKNILGSVTGGEKAKILQTSTKIAYVLGRAYALQGKFVPSETEFKNADKICRELETIDSRNAKEWAVKINSSRAKVSCKQAKYASAIRYYERAIQLAEDCYGVDSEDIIPIYQGLGKVQLMNDQNEEAINSFLQAHSIAASAHKGGGESVAQCEVALAQAYIQWNTPDALSAAEGHYDSALAQYITLYGATDPQVVKVKDELAQLYIAEAKHEEAISCLKESLPLKVDNYGEFSEPVADSWKIIANAYLSMGELIKAAEAFKRCYNIECELFTKNHKRSKDTKSSLDILLANPQVAEKFKTKADELNQRPRFNSIVSRTAPLGGFKPN